jgi:stage II sporulation protein AB (anti-sigma F factor)
MESNKMKIQFDAKSQNESFARSVVACFVLQLNPSVAEISDIKTAVSEAVTNAIVHGYRNSQCGEITMETVLEENIIHINIFDNGVGIDDVDQALEPFFTTRPEDERSGMGFTIMKSFMDDVKVVSSNGQGTKVYMSKKIKTNV